MGFGAADQGLVPVPFEFYISLEGFLISITGPVTTLIPWGLRQGGGTLLSLLKK